MSAVRGATRLRLFPLLVKAGAGQYLVIRRDTGRMLRTTESGVESIRLLRKGLTIDGTRAAVGAKYGCAAADVDIMPLITRLLDADFVEAIDDRTISARRAIGVWAWCRRHAMFLLAPMLSKVIRWAPIGVSVRLILRRRPSRDPVAVEQIARNMRRVPALAAGGVDIDRLAAENGAALRGFYFERLLLAGLTPASLDHWLRTRARVDGLAHLEGALAGGRGAILCAFHMTSYSMIPFVLASRGYPQTVLMDATDDSAREVRARITQVQDAGYPYAIEPVAAHRSARIVLRRLQGGTPALLLFDPTVPPSRKHATVPFLGASLRVARGLARLALRTSVPVLPVCIRSEGTGRYRIEIRSPLTEPERATEQTMLAALARTLESEVLARPATWLKWRDFHNMADYQSGHHQQESNHG